MPAVTRWLFLAFVALAAVGCSLEPDPQWYKPGSQSYTVAEFQRDHAECTKNRQLDETCLRGRGWVPLSGDVAPGRQKTLEEREQERRGKSGGRY
jgi:hypothetical protein